MVSKGWLFTVEILKVSSQSQPNKVAGAIAGILREQEKVELQAMGAGAANQALKSIAIARNYLIPSGIDVLCAPSFFLVELNGEEKTAIKIIAQRCAVLTESE